MKQTALTLTIHLTLLMALLTATSLPAQVAGSGAVCGPIQKNRSMVQLK